MSDSQVTFGFKWVQNETSSSSLSLPSLAIVCGAAVASPGHPEQGEPPVSARSDIGSPSVRSAQMAAVHPVQNGSGGDPVVWGCLTVLSHVTYYPVTSEWSGSSHLHESALTETSDQKKGLLCKIMLCGIPFDGIIQHLKYNICICTVNLC